MLSNAFEVNSSDRLYPWPLASTSPPLCAKWITRQSACVHTHEAIFVSMYTSLSWALMFVYLYPCCIRILLFRNYWIFPTIILSLFNQTTVFENCIHCSTKIVVQIFYLHVQFVPMQFYGTENDSSLDHHSVYWSYTCLHTPLACQCCTESLRRVRDLQLNAGSRTAEFRGIIRQGGHHALVRHRLDVFILSVYWNTREFL